MADKPRIAVIGSSMMDLVNRVVKMPRVGETIESQSFSINFGGKGANQAVAAAKLGADVLMLTKVGDDLFGPGYIRNFNEQGVDTRYAGTVPGAPTGTASISVDDAANNCIQIFKGANSLLLPRDVDEAAADLVRCGIIILQNEIPLETTYHAVRFGEKHGIPVILNPAPASRLDFGIVRRASFLVPNETELEVISGLPVGRVDEAKTAARTLLEKGLATVLVTLGDKGALWLNHDGGELLVPPHPVKPMDTTGAGDAFIGSFAYHLLTLGDMEKAVIMANRYAAASTTRPGAQVSYPTAAEFAAMAQ